MADQTPGPDAEQLADQVRQLRTELSQLTADLWTARDATIAAEAETAALRIENRELEVLACQLRDALAAQTRWARWTGKLTGNRFVSTAITRAKALARP
jgi:septal ring factor EnvC (AmiA/AmiB activator)